jgi:hypothetical protein
MTLPSTPFSPKSSPPPPSSSSSSSWIRPCLACSVLLKTGWCLHLNCGRCMFHCLSGLYVKIFFGIRLSSIHRTWYRSGVSSYEESEYNCFYITELPAPFRRARVYIRVVLSSSRTYKTYFPPVFVLPNCMYWGHTAWGTMLQPGRSRVRYPMRSLVYSIDPIFPAALWPWGRLSL